MRAYAFPDVTLVLAPCAAALSLALVGCGRSDAPPSTVTLASGAAVVVPATTTAGTAEETPSAISSPLPARIVGGTAPASAPVATPVPAPGLPRPAAPSAVTVEATPPLAPSSLVTNAEVVRLAKQALAEAVIIDRIQRGPSNLDITPDALVSLRQQGVSEGVLLAMLEASPRPGPTGPLGNSDVIQMVRRGQTEEQILATIRVGRTAFDLRTDQLVSLRAGGVPQRVIGAMLEAQASDRAGASTSGTEPRLSPGVARGQGADGPASARVVDAQRAPEPAVPARSPAPNESRTIRLSSSRDLVFAQGQVRYERRNPGGDVHPESFDVPCSEVLSWQPGAFDLSLRVVLRNGARYTFDVRNLQMSQLTAAFRSACGQR